MRLRLKIEIDIGMEAFEARLIAAGLRKTAKKVNRSPAFLVDVLKHSRSISLEDMKKISQSLDRTDVWKELNKAKCRMFVEAKKHILD